jgi:Na+/H+ antiporter NhaD/arsenite permease-like protein
MILASAGGASFFAFLSRLFPQPPFSLAAFFLPSVHQSFICT